MPNRQALVAWAREHGVQVPAPCPLATEPGVRPIFAKELDAACREFRGYERVMAFALVDEPVSTDNGLLTPTLKVRRAEVLKKFGPVLESLYARPEPPGASAR